MENWTCHCRARAKEEEDKEYAGYDELNGYNAEDEYEAEGEVEADGEGEYEGEGVHECEYDVGCEYEALCKYGTDSEANAMKRDEVIYTQVFNNHKIPTTIPLDFHLGSIEDWGLTCSTFNNAEKGLMFATIYIVYNNLVCDNIHPFQEMNNLTELLSAHVIHN